MKLKKGHCPPRGWQVIAAIAALLFLVTGCSSEHVILTYKSSDQGEVVLLRQVSAWMPAKRNRSIALPNMLIGIGARTAGELIVDDS